MNNHITSEESKTNYLYHYTTKKGLLGILESNCLWATQYKYLNDHSEITFAKEILKKALLEKSENGKKFIEYSFDIIYDSFEKYDIYTTSLCDAEDTYTMENGLLSQWRGYGNDDGGVYAIVFNKENLVRIFEEEERLGDIENEKKDEKKKTKFLNRRVVYSKLYSNGVKNDKEEINNYLEKFKDEISEIVRLLDRPDDIDLLIHSWIKCISFYKSEGFKEEKEFRFVASLGRGNSSSHKKIKNPLVKPYIELFDKNKMDANGKEDRTENTPLPIEKIIVGPHKDKEKHATLLKDELASMGKSNITVTISEIPFIGR